MRPACVVFALLVPALARAQAGDSPGLARAVRQIDDGDLEGAVDSLTGLLKKGPSGGGSSRDTAQIHFYLGVAYAAADNEKAALASFREALKRDPKLTVDPDHFPHKVIRLVARARGHLAPAAAKTVPAPAPSPSPPAATEDAVPSPREIYAQAYADFARGNYDAALQGFEHYLQLFPETDISDNARYWIGECLYAQQKFDVAIESWDRLMREYPSSDKLPDATFRKGLALEHIGRRNAALTEYRLLVERFPNSEAARRARERLTPQ